MPRILFIAACAFLVLSAFTLLKKKRGSEEESQARIELGREMFFDKALSDPDGQACSVCHAPKTSFSDPNHEAVSEGMRDGFFVNRNSQSLAYVSFVPSLTYDEKKGVWKGGLFWDGRSNTLEHQLSGPFFNIAEMNNADTAMLAAEIRKAAYYPQYKQLYGKAKDETTVYNNIIEAISFFERSDLFNEFSSKYDHVVKGKATFTEQEQNGFDLFNGKGQCINCHSTEPVNGQVLFTDFSYHNIGVPRNALNPFYTTDSLVNPIGQKATDLGLGPIVKDEKQNGKFRTPTLRNVQYTSPYFHNGLFHELDEVVHFINTRDVKSSHASEAEVPLTVDHVHTGNLGLTAEEEQAIVVFLLTLSDGYEAR